MKPVPGPRPVEIPAIVVTAAVVVREGKLLLTRRREGDHLGGTWEFPGGKLHDGESPPQGLRRELAEELGVEAEVGDPFRFAWWEYPEKKVLLLFYRCRIVAGEPRPLECAAVGWFDEGEIGALPMPPADRGILGDVRALVRESLREKDFL